jgi:cation:H+ antiporter
VSPALAVLLFAVSAVATFAAAGFFADRLDHLGPRLGLPEAVVGLLTAFAADTPEISSALAALAKGDKQVSLGVVLGSNVFNLAAMVGLSAVVTGSVVLLRRTLVIEGVVSLLSLLVTAGLLVGALPAAVAIGLLVALLVPYLALTLRSPDPRPAEGKSKPPHAPDRHPQGAILKPIALIVPAVALIVVGSTGMVRSALVLADHWHVSQTVTGFLVLAVLTSLPNAFTAVRLGLSRRGDALVSETLASNTINLAGGILIPALVAGIAGSTGSIDFDLLWLFGMTGLALLWLGTARGLGRWGGVVLIVLYGVFVAVQIALA